MIGSPEARPYWPQRVTGLYRNGRPHLRFVVTVTLKWRTYDVYLCHDTALFLRWGEAPGDYYCSHLSKWPIESFREDDNKDYNAQRLNAVWMAVRSEIYK